MMTNVEEITFETIDGWSISGTVTSGTDPSIAVVISAGTGFRGRFYRHVAAYFAERGAAVLTYDYRGSGGSRNRDLDFSGIAYFDYAKDLSAAVKLLDQRYPELSIVHVAHSVGGHFIGLVPNHERISRHVFVGVGSGFWRVHHRTQWLREFYFWWVLGTYSLLRWGYLQRTGGWKGEPLPPAVFRTWRKWSHRRGYHKPDIQKHPTDDSANIRTPIDVWILSDDGVATEQATRDLMSVYPNVAPAYHFRTPASANVSRLGHDGAFRPGCEVLWLEWWKSLTGDN